MSKQCKSCGMEFDERSEKCPYCGFAEETAPEQEKTDTAPESAEAEQPAEDNYFLSDADSVVPQQSDPDISAPYAPAPEANYGAYAQPQPYAQQGYYNAPVSPVPEAKPKKKKTGIIIAVIAAIVLIAVIVTGVILISRSSGGDSGSNSKKKNHDVTIEVGDNDYIKYTRKGNYVFTASEDGTYIFTVYSPDYSCGLTDSAILLNGEETEPDSYLPYGEYGFSFVKTCSADDVIAISVSYLTLSDEYYDEDLFADDDETYADEDIDEPVTSTDVSDEEDGEEPPETISITVEKAVNIAESGTASDVSLCVFRPTESGYYTFTSDNSCFSINDSETALEKYYSYYDFSYIYVRYCNADEILLITSAYEDSAVTVNAVPAEKTEYDAFTKFKQYNESGYYLTPNNKLYISTEETSEYQYFTNSGYKTPVGYIVDGSQLWLAFKMSHNTYGYILTYYQIPIN